MGGSEIQIASEGEEAMIKKHKWWLIGGVFLAVVCLVLGLWDALLALCGVGVGAGILQSQLRTEVFQEEKVQTYTDQAIKEVYADVMKEVDSREDLDKRKRDLLDDL